MDDSHVQDRLIFLYIQFDQIRLQWRGISPRTSPHHFQPGRFLIFIPDHERKEENKKSVFLLLLPV
ncbi:MAG: hypothetical protein OP8BY_1099 [Candidatus Saccharicenans subterraneus]|uniref:Uncharacterized protein n=1 Tax=Candidatus Saccharicenans subterraneus TaxID=2508984 RepID=A0A3E2BR88_9BACT|nr:MAG: hypothetical protein OP8BY_1099 [Candidatus Saccharicenans subterraneum]